MIMPDSAIVPSIATKPNGLPNASSASDDADQAERRGQHDHRRAREAAAAGSSAASARRARTAARRRRSTSGRAPNPRSRRRSRCGSRAAARRAAASSVGVDLRCATSGPCASPRTSARTVIVGRRLRRQTMPSSKLVLDVGDLRERHGACRCASGSRGPARKRQRARSSAAPRSTHLDQLVALAVVRDGEPDSELLRNAARSCDETPSTRALFWSIVEADHLGRLVPVELHVATCRDRRA